MIEPLRFSDEQKAAYKAVMAPEASDTHWNFFITECERRNLVPGTHVVFQLRNAEEFSREHQRKVSVQKVTLITTINALRLIAERSGKYHGHSAFLYHYMGEGETLTASQIPLGRIPHVVSANFFRAGWQEPLFATARFDAYKQEKSGGGLTRMWQTRGEEQLAKCCEAAGLRAVAPEECGGLYLAEEFGGDEASAPENKTTADIDKFLDNKQPPPTPTVAPAVNQAPAVAQAETAPHIQTSPIREVAEASTVAPAQPATAGTAAQPAIQVAPAPAKPAAPKPPAPKPPSPKPPAAPAASSAPQPPVVPAKTVEQAKAETAAEIQQDNEQLTQPEKEELQARIERDKDPKPPAAPPAAPATPAVAAPKPAADGNGPATLEQYNAIIKGRATKIVRDKLDKVAGAFKPTEAGRSVLAYMLKKSGQTDLRKASAATLESIVSELELATPEAAVQLVKGA